MSVLTEIAPEPDRYLSCQCSERGPPFVATYMTVQDRDFSGLWVQTPLAGDSGPWSEAKRECTELLRDQGKIVSL